jgi:hypothetical protein
MRSLAPLADEGTWEETSDATDDYNCAAHAAKVDDAWWWPDPEATEYFWPHGAPREETIEAFVAGYQTLGFEECQDGALEAGYEKIVIYANLSGSPRHVARQCPDGRWSSKLGGEEDIAHDSPETLAAGLYGYPARFMRRRLET